MAREPSYAQASADRLGVRITANTKKKKRYPEGYRIFFWLEGWYCYKTLDWEGLYPAYDVVKADLLEILSIA